MAEIDSNRTMRTLLLWAAPTRFLGMVAVVGSLAAVVAFAPTPLADHLIEADFRDSATVYEARILRQLTAGEATFTTGALSAGDRMALSAVARSSDIHSIDLLDREGRIFWSSRPNLIGTLHEGSDFAGIVAQGDVNFGIDLVPPAEMDDLLRAVIGSEADSSLRAVAEIEVPVMLDGGFVGALDLRRDITHLREAFTVRIRAVLGLLSVGAALALLTVVALLDRANRIGLGGAEARTAEQRIALAEQTRLARKVRLLGELNEWLQSSRSLPELFSMVARFMSHTLPDCSGSLYVYSNSRDVLDGAVSWNGATHDDRIHPHDCWGLRRGRTYAFGESEIDVTCGHMHHDTPRRYVCIPILAHGETVGLMTLGARSGTTPEGFESQRRIAQTSAEQISLAVANVRLRDELHYQAIRDPLTGLYNRRHMLDTLRRLIEGRFPGGAAVVSIDVDHFKLFNDNHGHDAGDMVLRAVGEVLGRHEDGDAIACRIGGEELMLLLPGASQEDALAQAEQVRQEVASLSVRYGDRLLPRITISMGVALHPRHGAIPQELIRAADDALYEAKARGRNQVVLAGSGGSVAPAASAPPRPGGALGDRTADLRLLADVGPPQAPTGVADPCRLPA